MKDNVLIAKFMGELYGEKQDYVITPYGKFSLNNSKYHKSWDWLMPVLNKINTIREAFYNSYYEVRMNDCKITRAFYKNIYMQEIMVDLEEMILIDTSIKDAYSKAVKFIKWYNKQKV